MIHRIRAKSNKDQFLRQNQNYLAEYQIYQQTFGFYNTQNVLKIFKGVL
jgi:hypothetical protein